MSKPKSKRAWPWFPCLLAGLVLTGCDAGEPPTEPSESQKAPSVQAPTSGFTLEHALQIRVAERPIDIGPKVQLANLYYDQKRFTEAIPMYLEALELEPKNASLRTDLGTCYVSLERYDEARASYEQVMRDNPTHVQSVYNLGVVEKAEGNLAEAAILWDKAADLAKDGKEAQLMRSMAQRARREADNPVPGK